MAALFIALWFAGPVWDFHLPGVNGKAHSASEWKDKRAVVLLFLSTECPISNRYAPAINRLHHEYSGKGVLFYVVQSDPDLKAPDAKKHAAEFGFEMPVLMDPKQVLASKAGASVTPTAVILSVNASILYQGRIDDRNIDLGKYRDTPKREDLKIAIEEVLAGKAVSERTTKVVGCFLPALAGNR